VFGRDPAAMAVPKKKTSKSKRNQRHAVWKAKAATAAQRAMSIGKSVLSGRAQGFVYPVDEADDSES
tara:strand:- start:19634 stop:19834 length:201 start_codon:yes stop_codon:yes gene_type:complete